MCIYILEEVQICGEKAACLNGVSCAKSMLEKVLKHELLQVHENYHHDCWSTLYSLSKPCYVMILKFEISQDYTIFSARQIMGGKR